MKRGKLLDYYESSWNGEPSCRLALEIADSFHKIDNTILWMGTLGCLEAYLMERLSNDEYLLQYDYLRGHCNRLNPDIVLSSQSSLGSSHHTTVICKEGRIRSESEFRFLLMRHWNIQDAMRHSRYIVGRLQTWRDRGKRRLSELFAKMG
jgi:cell division control protein 45